MDDHEKVFFFFSDERLLLRLLSLNVKLFFFGWVFDLEPMSFKRTRTMNKTSDNQSSAPELRMIYSFIVPGA